MSQDVRIKPVGFYRQYGDDQYLHILLRDTRRTARGLLLPVRNSLEHFQAMLDRNPEFLARFQFYQMVVFSQGVLERICFEPCPSLSVGCWAKIAISSLDDPNRKITIYWDFEEATMLAMVRQFPLYCDDALVAPVSLHGYEHVYTPETIDEVSDELEREISAVLRSRFTGKQEVLNKLLAQRENL